MLTTKELLYLDQVGDLRLTKDNRDLINDVVAHVLSIQDPHRRVFLAHLKKVNPPLEKRAQQAVTIQNEADSAATSLRLSCSRKKLLEEEKEFRKKHSIDTVFAKARKLFPGVCGMWCMHELFFKKIDARESVVTAIECLMGSSGYGYRDVLPCFMDTLKELKQLKSAGGTLLRVSTPDSNRAFFLYASEEAREKVIHNMRSENRKNRVGYEIAL